MTTTEIIIKEIHNIWHTGDEKQNHEAWLLIDGKPVSWVKLMDNNHTSELLTICDVETREGYERKGYARTLLNMVEKEMGKPLALTGGFTPEGFAALHGKYPVLPGYTDYGYPTFESMRFVRDWDNMLGVR